MIFLLILFFLLGYLAALAVAEISFRKEMEDFKRTFGYSPITYTDKIRALDYLRKHKKEIEKNESKRK